MKVSDKEKQQIQKIYQKYRSAGYRREAALKRTAKEVGRGRTTIYDNTVELYNPKPKERISVNYKPSWPKTAIITAWEIRVGIDKKFVETLKQMAKFYDAELFLTLCQESDINYVPQEIKDVFTIVTEDIEFNSNLKFKYVETNALLQSPLSGHQGAYPDTTTIVPGLIKEASTEPSQFYVKQLISTGSIGYLNARVNDYDDNEDEGLVKKWRSANTRRNGKTTAIAKNYVVPSALVIDVLDNKTFLTRFVTSLQNGVVFDLDKKFTPNGVSDSRPSALVVGDTHALSVDNDAIVASIDMIRDMGPRETILNDFFDGLSVNHHIIADPIKFKDVPTLEEEAKITRNLLEIVCDVSDQVVYLQSNHDNFLESWLSGPASMWRLNYNYAIACDLQTYRAQTGNHPIIKLLDLESIPNLNFVTEKENYYVGNVLVKHGHESINGARAGFKTMAKTYNRYVQGHLHTPAVFRNAAMAGLTAKLDQSYNVGASNWLHANVIIQPDGSLQLLPIIRGIWRNYNNDTNNRTSNSRT